MMPTPITDCDFKDIVSAIINGIDLPLVDDTLYKRIIGKFMYAMVATRPDITFAVSFLGRYAADPKEIHFKAAYHLIEYLRTYPGVSIYYPCEEGTIYCKSYVGADWGGAIDCNYKSTSGYIQMINNVPINWSSKLQLTTALSSTEAEYMATKDRVKEIIWTRRLLTDLGHPQKESTIIFEDNNDNRISQKSHSP